MSDQLDRDLDRAIKDEVVREMQGFEFSTQMKANVMKQIRAGQSGLVVPFERPKARRGFVVPRPLVWAVVAVATFAFALNLNRNPDPLDLRATEEGTGLVELHKGLSAPAPAMPGDQAPSSALGMSAMSSDLIQGPTRIIDLPNVAYRMAAPTAPPSTMMAPPALNLQVAAFAKNLMVLNSDGIRRLDPSLAQLWHNNPGGISPESLMDVNADGLVAVSAGNKVHLISDRGKWESTLELPGTISGLAWGTDGRLAVTSGSSLTVFYGDRPVQQLTVHPGSLSAFVSDGSLVTFSTEAIPKRLTLNTANGDRAFQIDLPEAGQGLTIIHGGQTILAGGIAVDLSGQVLWQLDFQPDGVSADPMSDVSFAWLADSVVAVRSDGQEVWRARLEGSVMHRVAVSDDGRLAVVATSVSEPGATVFVLDMTGDLLLSERANAIPVDIAIAGTKLFVLYSDGHQEFTFR